MADTTGVVALPLSRGAAYGIVLDFGIVFALTRYKISEIPRRLLQERTVMRP